MLKCEYRIVLLGSKTLKIKYWLLLSIGLGLSTFGMAAEQDDELCNVKQWVQSQNGLTETQSQQFYTCLNHNMNQFFLPLEDEDGQSEAQQELKKLFEQSKDTVKQLSVLAHQNNEYLLKLHFTDVGYTPVSVLLSYHDEQSKLFFVPLLSEQSLNPNNPRTYLILGDHIEMTNHMQSNLIATTRSRSIGDCGYVRFYKFAKINGSGIGTVQQYLSFDIPCTTAEKPKEEIECYYADIVNELLQHPDKSEHELRSIIKKRNCLEIKEDDRVVQPSIDNSQKPSP